MSADWETSSFVFTADGPTTIEFTDIGISDSYGTFLDDVKLFTSSADPEPEPVECQEGEILDEQTNTCVPKPVCGEGEIFDGEQCVPEVVEPVCEEGQVFDEELLICTEP